MVSQRKRNQQRQQNTNRRGRKGGSQWQRKEIRPQVNMGRAQQRLLTTPCVVLLNYLPAYKLKEALPSCVVLLKRLPPMTFQMPFPFPINLSPPTIRKLRPLKSPN